MKVQTTAAAEAALYRARLYAQARAAAEAVKARSEEAWAAIVAFYAEMQASNMRARSVLFRNWQQAEERMRLSITQVGNLQTDIIMKARIVVENARKQAYILI